MKFTISRETLLRPLKAALPTVSTDNSLPVLTHFLLDYQSPPALTVTAGDTESEYQAVVATAESGVAGYICVPARKLFDIVRLLPESSDLAIELDGAKIKLRAGRSRYQLSTLPAAHFPGFDQDDVRHEFQLDAALLRRALDAVAPASGVKDVRYWLNGTLLRVDGEALHVVASDGFRIARYVADKVAPFYGRLNAIIPRLAAIEMAKSLRDESGEVNVSIGERSLRLTIRTDTYSTRLIEGAYPDYEKLIPQEFTSEMICGRTALISALQRVGTLSGDNRAVRLGVTASNVVLSGANSDDEQAQDEVEATCTGDHRERALNLDYLLSFLSNIFRDTVKLRFDSAGRCIVTGDATDDYLAMIAPIRV